MRTQLYDKTATKRPVNISMNRDLVAKAKAEGLNLSALTEDAVATALARRARERWDAEIAEAIKAHEVYLAEYGSLGDILREYHSAEE